MNKPVAWMQTFTQVKDGIELVKHAVNIEQVGINDIPLYTHPVKELNDGGEPVKNATYWKRQYNLMATQNDNLKSGLYHANEQIKYLEGQLDTRTRELIGASFYEHDYKTLMAKSPLTDEEIVNLYESSYLQSGLDEWEFDPVYFAKAILRKAQEK